MTGTDDYLPVMADCERALGRPHNAIKLAGEAARLELEPALAVEMTIVEAGARRDLGQDAEARRLLERAVKLVRPDGALAQPVARLRYAYADVLAAADEVAEARQWFAAAARLDPEQETDAQARMDELDGFLIEFDDTEDDLDDDVDDQAAGEPQPRDEVGPDDRGGRGPESVGPPQ
jgi:tetratricopeptide (TPR) repeat protein